MSIKLLSLEEIEQRIQTLEATKRRIGDLIALRHEVAELQIKARGDITIGPSMGLEVMKAVCAYFNVSLEALQSRAKHDSIVIPRHVAMWLILELTPCSQSACGSLFFRDHGTALYGRDHVREIMSVEPEFKNKMEAFKQSVRDLLAKQFPGHS